MNNLKSLFYRSLFEFELTVNTILALSDNGLHTLGEVAMKTADEISRLSYQPEEGGSRIPIHKGAVDEIENILKEFGTRLGNKIPGKILTAVRADRLRLEKRLLNLERRYEALRNRYPTKYRERAEANSKILSVALGRKRGTKPAVERPTSHRTLPELVERVQRLARCVRELEKDLKGLSA